MKNKYDYGAFSGRITVNLEELQILTGCGRPTALKIASEAGAVVRIGGRKLYLVSKIKDYLEGHTDQCSDGTEDVGMPKEMDAKQRLSENIRKAYEKCGKSTRQIQRESGLSAKTIYRWFSGEYVPNAISLKIYCDTVGTTITEIYEGV